MHFHEHYLKPKHEVLYHWEVVRVNKVNLSEDARSLKAIQVLPLHHTHYMKQAIEQKVKTEIIAYLLRQLFACKLIQVD